MFHGAAVAWKHCFANSQDLRVPSSIIKKHQKTSWLIEFTKEFTFSVMFVYLFVSIISKNKKQCSVFGVGLNTNIYLIILLNVFVNIVTLSFWLFFHELQNASHYYPSPCVFSCWSRSRYRLNISLVRITILDDLAALAKTRTHWMLLDLKFQQHSLSV